MNWAGSKDCGQRAAVSVGCMVVNSGMAKRKRHSNEWTELNAPREGGGFPVCGVVKLDLKEVVSGDQVQEIADEMRRQYREHPERFIEL